MSGKDGTLISISKAARLLSVARELPEFNMVRIAGEAAIRMAKQYRDVGIDAIIDAQVIVRTAEIRMGKELAGMGIKAGRPGNSNIMLPLSEYGLTKMQSSRFQAEAKIPDEVFTSMVEKCRQNEKDLTQSSIVAYVKKSEKKLRDATAAAAAAKALAETEENRHVYHGDSFELANSILDASCALVFADPPYSTDHVPQYGELAEEACRVLIDGGSLLCYFGHRLLPKILDAMAEPGDVKAAKDELGTSSTYFPTWKPQASAPPR